jgi:uncharacterized membrane protein YczE
MWRIGLDLLAFGLSALVPSILGDPLWVVFVKGVAGTFGCEVGQWLRRCERA